MVIQHFLFLGKNQIQPWLKQNLVYAIPAMSSEDHSKLFVRSKAGPFLAHTMSFRPTSLHHLILGCLTGFFWIGHDKKKENIMGSLASL